MSASEATLLHTDNARIISYRKLLFHNDLVLRDKYSPVNTDNNEHMQSTITYVYLYTKKKRDKKNITITLDQSIKYFKTAHSTEKNTVTITSKKLSKTPQGADSLDLPRLLHAAL